MPADLRIFRGHPRDEGDRRIKAQRLFEDIAHERHTTHLLELQGSRAALIDLGTQPRHRLRLQTEDHERPDECARRGLVPGEEHHPELVEQFLAREAGTGLHIARGDDLGRDIVVRPLRAVRGTGLRRRQVAVDQFPEVMTDPLAGRKHLGMLGDGGERPVQDQTLELDLGAGALEDGERLEHIDRRLRA